MSDKWTLLLVGPENGLVGKHGEEFNQSPDWYDRVDVVRADHHAELVEALRALMVAADNIEGEHVIGVSELNYASLAADKLLTKLEREG